MPRYEQGQISASDYYYCMLLLPLLIYFLQAYNIFHGLGGNDAIMYKDWSSKPLVIYSELHEP